MTCIGDAVTSFLWRHSVKFLFKNSITCIFVSTDAILMNFFLFLMFFGSGNSFQLVTNAWPSRMTLKLKVMWCCTWPLLTVAVLVQNRWIFFVSNVLWVREFISTSHNCVTSTVDLETQGHVMSYMKVTYLWLVEMNSLTQKPLETKQIPSFLDKHSKSWWRSRTKSYDFEFSRSSVKVTHLRLVGINSLTQDTLETKKFHRFWTSTAKVSKNHVQHHMTLSFKVNRENHAFVTSWNEFRDPKNIRNNKKSIVLRQAQPKLVKVTYNITWPWVSRSSVKITHLWLVGMNFVTQKTLETKKIHRSCTTTAKVSKGRVQHHVTLSFKVIRNSHAFLTSWNEFPDPKNIRNKENPSFLDKYSHS